MKLIVADKNKLPFDPDYSGYPLFTKGQQSILNGIDIMPYLDEIEKAYATYKASCLQNVIDEYVREYKPAPFNEFVIACIQAKQAGF